MSTPVGELPSKLPMIDTNEDEEIRNVLKDIEQEISEPKNNNINNIQDLQNQLYLKEHQLLEHQRQLEEIKNISIDNHVDNNKVEKAEDIEVKSNDSQRNIDNIVSISNIFDKIKPSLYIVFLFFILSIMPIEKFIYRYISLYKIPYSDIIIKSILAGVLFFLITKI